MPPRQDVVVSCENIQKTYLLGTEGVAALRGVSLDIYEGEFCVIYGNSGGGKTTLLNILGTIDQPTKGNLSVMGYRLTPRTDDSVFANLRLHHLGFVFQTFNLLSTMTAEENVRVPMVLAGELSGEEQAARATDLLRKVGLLERRDHYPSMLSGGEQQRVTIARAMANSPSVLLLDEPTGDLDTRNTKIVLDLLLRLNREERVTLIMVTHDPDMKWYANRAVYVQDGKIGRIDTIDADQNIRATHELKCSLEKGGAEPGGLESGLKRGDDQDERVSVRSAGGASAANTEIRRPHQYATFCEESLSHANAMQDGMFSNVFSASDAASVTTTASTANMSGVQIELSSQGSRGCTLARVEEPEI